MVKITLGISGMACGMCEAHINDTVRAAFDVKKCRPRIQRAKPLLWQKMKFRNLRLKP